ncbi:DMT family transporter [Arenibaculum pallidiluteum]|uniref:DMT family transporter n=1 Tax=Arenibaculum pallidiluteum TaxID=2812559 RepID=UPI001A97204E|nr:DMT family transporter [Arenibaculum pallidiluteum]
MPDTRSPRWAYPLLIVSPVMMVSNMLAARWVAGEIPAVAMAFWRWAITLLVLLPFVLPRLHAHRRALRREWRPLMALGALGMGLCGAPVYLGAQTITATNIGLIYAASPVLILVLARIFWGEPVAGRQAAGIALCLLGVLAILAKGDPMALAALSFVEGDLWIIMSMLAWALYSVLLRYSRSDLPLLVRFEGMVAAGVACTLPFYLAEIALGQTTGTDLRTIGVLLFLALVPGIGAFLAYNRLVAVLGPARTGLTLYLGPLYNAGLAWMLLDEAPQLHHLLGAALILPGIFLATVRPRA